MGNRLGIGSILVVIGIAVMFYHYTTGYVSLIFYPMILSLLGVYLILTSFSIEDLECLITKKRGSE